MTREEYLQKVSENIRWKVAVPTVRSELENHIIDQKEAFMTQGIPEDTAENLAVREMGNPEETGLQLDKIHRPKHDASLFCMLSVIVAFGILMQCILFGCAGNSAISSDYPAKTVLFNIIGAGIMIAIYFLDYRLFCRHTWKIYFGYLGFSAFFSLISMPYYSLFYARSNAAYSLFIPLFAAFVYRFRGQKGLGIIKCLGLLLFQQIFFGIIFGTMSLPYFCAVIVTCLLILFLAVCKDYFGGRKKLHIILFLLFILGLPLFFFIDFLFSGGALFGLKAYQVERLNVILHPADYTGGASYVLLMARQQMENCTFGGTATVGALGELSEAYSDYIVTCMFSYFGAGITMLLLLVFALFLSRTLQISLFQPNRFGFLASTGVVIFLFVKVAFYVLSNLGLLPASSIDMPFLSYGFFCTISNYLLVGFVLSVYRYSNA